VSNNSQTLVCNAVMDIATVADLKTQLQEIASRSGAVVLDGSQVERIDTAALQLLASFHREMTRVGSPPEWQSPSNVLRQSARLLNLDRHIGLDEATG